MSIKQSSIASAWKMATVTPIFKSGSSSDMINYRPISIFPAISKVAEKWIADLTIKHLDKGHIPLHLMQFGSCACYSTESANCFFYGEGEGFVGLEFLCCCSLLRSMKGVRHGQSPSPPAKLADFNFSLATLQWFKSYCWSHK